MAYSDALAALADPTRRKVFERLRSGPKPVGRIARGLPVSRPAVSQHLKVLKEAGLVTDRPEGTRRVYYIDPDGLGALRAWLDRFWDDALLAFKTQAEAEWTSNASPSSLPGSTRQSMPPGHERRSRMGARVKPAHDESKIGGKSGKDKS